MKKELSLREIQLEENEILKSTINFLNKHKLNYYLIGGTLLGAIRHKGFIPWDDDIDIGLLRKDYDRLMEIAKTEKVSNNLKIVSFELNNLNYPYAKVINEDLLVNNNNNEDKNLWIDIFPIDFLPNNQLEIDKIIKKNMFYKKLLSSKIFKISSFFSRNGFTKKNFIKILVKIVTIFHNSNYYARKIHDNSVINNSDSKKIGVIVWGYGSKEVLSIDDINPTQVVFEGNKYFGFSNYDTYLKNLYGDYMKIPAKKDRYNHIMKVIRK